MWQNIHYNRDKNLYAEKCDTGIIHIFIEYNSVKSTDLLNNLDYAD